ncbi:hypothetical protein V2W45_1473474 [Cenococcum geophilum]
MVEFPILEYSGLFVLIGEIHLHLNLFSIFYGRPVLLINGNLPKQSLRGKTVIANKTRAGPFGLFLNEITNSIYTCLLFPFIDIFCFFYANLGSFRQIARYIATWLEKGYLLTLLKSTYLRVVIVTEKIPLGLLGEEIIKDLSKLILAINIVALFLNGTISVNACYRRLKEPLRIYNPVALNLAEYLLNFLKYVKSTNELTEFAVLMAAFSLFLDSYPPKAYSERPQYCLPYGYCICENYIIVFRDRYKDDPWIFKVRHCFLCREEIPNNIIVKVHPPTVGVGVLCINRGGIWDCRFIKVAFRVSIDCFYATSIGTKIGLPVTIVSSHPLYYIFTNYNGALLEVLVMFPLIKEPNFVISLGTTRYIIASLFYFKLDSFLERHNGKYIVTGYILCLITCSDPAFGALLSKLANNSAGFLINDWPIPGTFNNTSFIGKDGNFRKRVDLDTFRKFIISLKEGDAKLYNISRLPFLIENLIAA